MFTKLVQWHRDWEDEVLAVLADPAHAAALPAGMRRTLALRLAALSAIERRQLHDFSARYRGRRLYAALGALVLLLALAGGVLALAFPSHVNWLEALVLAELMGLTLAGTLVGAWFNYRKVGCRTPFGAGRALLAGVLALLAAFGLTLYLRATPPGAVLVARASSMLEGALAGAGCTLLLFGLVLWLRNRQHGALTLALQHEAERERLARQLSETQLRLLRSQIEPHFLFNTLGAVQQLAEQGAPRAAALTADLIDFLRASMQEMRAEHVTLAEEYALVGAYLKVMQVRLGARLVFSLDLPPPLQEARLPGMMVLTLVENAIKHGIEPALRGGAVAVSAALDEGALLLRVQDSGAGLAAVPGQGFGLHNIRERLQLAYPGQASLTLRADPDGGTVAELRLPLAPD